MKCIIREMKRWLILFLLLGQAHALELLVFDPSLERVVGYGSVQGKVFRLAIANDASGPVVGMLVEDKNKTRKFSGSIDKGILWLSVGTNQSLAKYVSSLGLSLKQISVSAQSLNKSQ